MTKFSDETVAALIEATEAALAYDQGICGRAIRGEVNLREDGSGTAEGADLDALYFAWQSKAAAAMILVAEERGDPV